MPCCDKCEHMFDLELKYPYIDTRTGKSYCYSCVTNFNNDFHLEDTLKGFNALGEEKDRITSVSGDAMEIDDISQMLIPDQLNTQSSIKNIADKTKKSHENLNNKTVDNQNNTYYVKNYKLAESITEIKNIFKNIILNFPSIPVQCLIHKLNITGFDHINNKFICKKCSFKKDEFFSIKEIIDVKLNIFDDNSIYVQKIKSLIDLINVIREEFGFQAIKEKYRNINSLIKELQVNQEARSNNLFGHIHKIEFILDKEQEDFLRKLEYWFEECKKALDDSRISKECYQIIKMANYDIGVYMGTKIEDQKLLDIKDVKHNLLLLLEELHGIDRIKNKISQMLYATKNWKVDDKLTFQSIIQKWFKSNWIDIDTSDIIEKLSEEN